MLVFFVRRLLLFSFNLAIYKKHDAYYLHRASYLRKCFYYILSMRN